jgi:hypothetical protein
MKILLFSKLKNDVVERFCREIYRLEELTPMRIDEYTAFERLVMKNKVEQLPVIFMASDNEDLNFAVALKEYLTRTRLIMIIPDKKKNMISRALSLNPSLLAFSKNDVQPAIALLERMASTTLNREIQEH